MILLTAEGSETILGMTEIYQGAGQRMWIRYHGS